MTYCLALRLNEGLVFLADTRTNAGIDNVGTYRKLHVFRPAPDRVFVLGNELTLDYEQSFGIRAEGAISATINDSTGSNLPA